MESQLSTVLNFVKLGVGSLLISVGSIASCQTTPNKPQAIIEEMITRYRTISSYQDSGVVRVVTADPQIARLKGVTFLPTSLEEEPIVSFKTYFVRPRMFRFEWKDSVIPGSREAIVWSDGKKNYRWTPGRFPRDGRFTLYDGGDLDFYISEAQGSSAGAIFVLPSMLMKIESSFSFGDILKGATTASLLKDEAVDGVMCSVIKVSLSEVPWTLWIGKDDHLLRKTRTLYSRGSFHSNARKTFVAEEFHRDIKIDERIDELIFKYKPQFQPGDVDLTR